jgi:hypothetical protein
MNGPLPINLWNKLHISWNSRFHMLIATHKLPLPFTCNSSCVHTHSSGLLRPWRWRQQPSTKCWYLFTTQHGVKSQKKWMSVLTNMKDNIPHWICQHQCSQSCNCPTLSSSHNSISEILAELSMLVPSGSSSRMLWTGCSMLQNSEKFSQKVL